MKSFYQAVTKPSVLTTAGFLKIGIKFYAKPTLVL